jgi:hypothetical protein
LCMILIVHGFTHGCRRCSRVVASSYVAAWDIASWLPTSV